ncbi:MAG: helix-turn-helix domain-containing protein [Firmicutes bacterium]|nr:helix-turn-helix domain-containing protein [Bacillota bacterium]
MDKFSKRLKELRKEKNLSAVELGKEIGVSGASIIHWEKNDNDITKKHLIKLAKFFEVSTDFLVGLSDDY